MQKKVILCISFLFVLHMVFILTVFSQELITISTYYPAPFGVYEELRSRRIAIGDSYVDSARLCWGGGSCVNPTDNNTDLVVEGNAGIGTANPLAKLDVAGEIKVGNSGLACNSGTTGAMRYNSDSVPARMEYCKNSQWIPIFDVFFQIKTSRDCGKPVAGSLGGGDKVCDKYSGAIGEWLSHVRYNTDNVGEKEAKCDKGYVATSCEVVMYGKGSGYKTVPVPEWISTDRTSCRFKLRQNQGEQGTALLEAGDIFITCARQ